MQQAAEALVMVGQGVSYTETADRMRVRSKRGRLADGAQLVANWVEILGPVVTAEHAVMAWPETVVLDSTWFMVTNTATNRRKQAFGVLAAYGYDQGSRQGRTLAFLATTQQTQSNWTELLRSRPGAPAMVVCDEEAGS